MFDASDFMMGFFFIVIVLLIVALVAMVGYAIYHDCTKVEVEVFSVGCEVTQMSYAEKATGKSSSRPVFKMGVRCDDFACTFDITDAQYAQYCIGDVVEVEVTVWECRDGDLRNTYRLLGPCQE